MLVNSYVLLLYDVFTVDAVAIDFVDFVDVAVVDCVEIVLVVNGCNFDTKKYKLYFKVSNILLLSESSKRMFDTISKNIYFYFILTFYHIFVTTDCIFCNKWSRGLGGHLRTISFRWTS